MTNDDFDLDLVETQLLMEALFRRCRAGVILLTQDRDEKSDSEAFMISGNEAYCLGLCEAMSARIKGMLTSEFLEEVNGEE